MNPKLFLSSVMLLFIGIMVYVWWGASQADPVFLDANGNAVHTQWTPK